MISGKNLCVCPEVTATGLAEVLCIKYDKVTQALAKGSYDSMFLWQYVKPYVRETMSAERLSVLILDDSIVEKRYSDESELICWHYDHCVTRSVKGVNFMTALLDNGVMRLPKRKFGNKFSSFSVNY